MVLNAMLNIYSHNCYRSEDELEQTQNLRLYRLLADKQQTAHKTPTTVQTNQQQILFKSKKD